ncbi:MAG: Thiol-disulfide oxidoreductase ResA [Ignavibacteria bacterium]|nr:Thiol-disulfide oxidoreductase ResA [Ignavibacteria bacterium]
MKTIAIKIFCLGIFALIISCSTDRGKNEAMVKLKVSNPARDFAEFRKKSDPSLKTDTIRFNKNGEAEIIVNPDTLTEYVILLGDEIALDTIKSSVPLVVKQKTQELVLLLDNGFRLNLSLDLNNISGSFKIEGAGSDINDYFIRKEFLKNNFNIKYAEMLRGDLKSYNKFVDDFRKSNEELINNIPDDSKTIPSGYKENEKKSLYFRYYGLKLNFANLNIKRETEDLKQLLPESGFAGFLKDIKLNNPENLNIASYRQLVNLISDYMHLLKYKDSSEAALKSPGNKYITLKQIFSGNIKDYMQYELLKKNINRRNEDWYNVALDDYLKNSETDSLKKLLSSLKEKKEKLEGGKPAPDFSYPDINGKMISLSEFRGNYIYIDVWATWCKPCIYEIPYLKKMEEDYHGRKIKFMSISIDEDIEKWKKTVLEKPLGGIQIIASDPDASIRKDYLISGIPRFILIGSEGEILNENAPRPSDPASRELLDSFLDL